MKIYASLFGDDVYVGIDKNALKNVVHSLGAAEIARRLDLHPDTVKLWYRKKDRSVPLYALKKICSWTGHSLDKFKVFYLGGKGRREIVSLPRLNLPFAYLVGIIVGDGHLYENRVLIASDECTIKKAIMPCVKALNFKCIVRRIEWKKREWFTLEINSRPLIWFLRDIFEIPIGKKVYTIHIPHIIKLSDQKIKAMFLRGLFDADGYVDKRGYVGFCTASRLLYDDVIQMLKSMHIKSIYKRVDNRGRNPVYHLRICKHEEIKKFSTLVGFNSLKKRKRLMNRIRNLKMTQKIT